MQTYELQKKLDRLASSVPDVLARLGIKGSTKQEIEEWRHRQGGHFGTRMGVKFKRDDGKLLWEPTSEWAWDHNIVTNQALDHVLDVTLSGGTAIAAAGWYVTLSASNTPPLATHTYQAPGFTEITTTEVAETVRESFGDNAVSAQSIANGTVAQYTADIAFTAYGAALLGGATTPSAFGDTSAGNILYASSLFASSKSLTASDTIDVTYTINSSDV